MSSDLDPTSAQSPLREVKCTSTGPWYLFRHASVNMLVHGKAPYQSDIASSIQCVQQLGVCQSLKLWQTPMVQH